MKITSAEFITSATEIKQYPPSGKPEFAMIGRSNVGKSSLINMFTGKKGLAKTSSTPGKTRLINFFLINNAWYLVDLPGYGFAKAAKTERRRFLASIADYIHERQNLVCLLVLIDARLPLQPADADFMAELGENKLPFVIVFTKIDKLKKQELALNIKRFSERMLREWSELPEMFFTSSKTGEGKEELTGFVGMNLYKKK